MCPRCKRITDLVLLPVNAVFLIINLSLLAVPAPAWITMPAGTVAITSGGMFLALHFTGKRARSSLLQAGAQR